MVINIYKPQKFLKMKKNSIIYKLSALVLSLIVVLIACEEDILVPPASTQADFTFTVEEIINDETDEVSYEVRFENKSVNASSYNWSFGNGETSTEENPVVIYDASGKYVITLTVTGPSDLYYNNLEKVEAILLGKNSLYFEDFTSEDEELPTDITTWDVDGDGFDWYWGIRSGDGQARSQSYDSDGDAALNPDNWLIMPAIDLTEFSTGALVIFRYTAGVSANTPRYRKENYGVMISGGEMIQEDFELIFEETFTEETPQWTPIEREIDISNYVGQVVYLAIRHFNVSDMDRMFISELEVYVIE